MSDKSSNTVYFQYNLATLNLINPDKSDFTYEIINFADGQRNVVINLDRSKIGPFAFHKIQIIIRINNFSDLEILICSVKALRNLGFEEIGLYIPYFLGSRSDKLFIEGSARYLKDVICPIINSLNFYAVKTLDPHSDVLENLINNFHSDDNSDLINFAISDVYKFNNLTFEENKSNFILMSPDGNSYKKIYKLAKKLEITYVECAFKIRDINTGEITNTIVNNQDFLQKDIFIIDDICDKGQTVIELAKILKQRNAGSIYLVVTHGIFSKGFQELNNFFKKIYCTNSYRDINMEDTIYHKLENHQNILPKSIGEFVIQQKLF